MTYRIPWRTTKLLALVSLVLLALVAIACTSTAEPTAPAAAATNTPSSAAASGTPTATAFFGQASTLEEFDKRFPFPPPPSKAPLKYGGTLIVPVTPWTNLDPRLGAAS